MYFYCATKSLAPSPAAIIAAISFGGIKNLSNNAGDSRNPLVDVSGNIVYVVWVDLTTPTGSGDILFKRSTDGGNTFGNTVNLSNDVEIPQNQSLPNLEAIYTYYGRTLVIKTYCLKGVQIMELHLQVL